MNGIGLDRDHNQSYRHIVEANPVELSSMQYVFQIFLGYIIYYI
jgi:hypothetical protein